MYNKILVPTDGSECAEKAAGHALEIAEKFDAEIHTLYVVDGSEFHDREFWDELMRSFKENGKEATGEVASKARNRGLDVTIETLIGVPHENIVQYSKDHDIDLVVMGTHGGTGLERTLMGSVTEKVVRTSEVPVLTVSATEEKDGNQ
ncbi:MAG: universal stress protein [Candidatus Nanohaloarchaea archaeon]